MSLTGILTDQFRQIKQGGIKVLLRKIGIGAIVLLSLPIVGIIRLLKPLLLIRLGDLNTSRIGHFSTNTALYVCRRQLSQLRSLDIFYHSVPVSNDQMKKMWDRRLVICPMARWWDKANNLLPGGQVHRITEHLDGKDPQGLYAQVDIPVAFTEVEERLGQEGLRRLGIPEGALFVCFHARNSNYLKKMFPERDFRYHNYRDSDITTYVPAIKELIRRGYYAVRMGKFESTDFPFIDPKMIDYSMIGQTDFMDIYLCSKCHFFLGTDAGLTSIPRLFKRPIVWVNYMPIYNVHSWDANSIFIPKKLWLTSEKRFLTYPELLATQMGKLLFNEEYVKLGIEPVANTEEEITDLVVEIEERLSGRWNSTVEDELMQQKFWSLYQVDNKFHGVFKARIGTLFLRKNRELFGSLLQAY